MEVFNPSSVSEPCQQRSEKVVKGVSTHWMAPRTLIENEREVSKVELFSSYSNSRD